MGIKGFKWIRRANKVDAFENAKTEKHEINYSRYIASWYKAGGQFRHLTDTLDFKDWLRSMDLSEDEVQAIANMAVCGKLELEDSAKAFIEKMQEEL